MMGTTEQQSAKCIVICAYGWVFMGDVKTPLTNWLHSDDAHTIRVWGTSAGLGEIALRGPTSRTVLEQVGVLDLPRRHVVAVIECPAPAPDSKHKHADKRIVVATFGWVFVGDFSMEGEWVTIKQSSVVRNWGTTWGLGELALQGPTKDTILDYSGTVKIPVDNIIGTIKCAK